MGRNLSVRSSVCLSVLSLNCNYGKIVLNRSWKIGLLLSKNGITNSTSKDGIWLSFTIESLNMHYCNPIKVSSSFILSSNVSSPNLWASLIVCFMIALRILSWMRCFHVVSTFFYRRRDSWLSRKKLEQELNQKLAIHIFPLGIVFSKLHNWIRWRSFRSVDITAGQR